VDGVGASKFQEVLIFNDSASRNTSSDAVKDYIEGFIDILPKP
jgi:hypothetical protein